MLIVKWSLVSVLIAGLAYAAMAPHKGGEDETGPLYIHIEAFLWTQLTRNRMGQAVRP